jgi:TPR repeat protein
MPPMIDDVEYDKAMDTGDADSLFDLGRKCLKSGKNSEDRVHREMLLKRAASLFARGAALDDPNCELAVGKMFAKGEHFGKNPGVAFEYIQSAARKGHEGALVDLADLYQEGKGVDRDEALAFELSTKAADLGSAAALNNLGLCFESGQGCEMDHAKALEPIKKAADLIICDRQLPPALGQAVLFGLPLVTYA